MIILSDMEKNGEALADNKPLQKPRLNTQLTVFREIVGINPTPALGFGKVKRPAPNKGIYLRTCQAESKARLQYYACAAIFNTCFLLQIVVAAALTAIGAAKGPHIAVTVLGAVNTVMAGILTYLKGQGLPNRLRQFQSELRKVRECIEERERDFSRLDCKLDLDHEIAFIWRLYEAVRQNNEDNLPDSYHNLTAPDGAKPAQTPGVQIPPGKQENADPNVKATANGTQVEVSAIEGPPGLGERSSYGNSVHVPIEADENLDGTHPGMSGGHPSAEKSASRNRRPRSMDIDPAATGELMAPYPSLRRTNGAISSRRPSSSIERSQHRHGSTARHATSRERPNSMTDRRSSVEIPSGAKDGASDKNITYAPLERPITPTRRSSNRNSAYEHTPPKRPRAPALSGHSSNRTSPYTLLQLPMAPNESMLGFDHPNHPADMTPAPGESSTNGNAGLAVPSRKNSTTPVKQFYTAAQRRG